MKIAVIFCLFFFSFLALAKNQAVKLDITLSASGKVLSNPRLNVNLGEEGRVIFQNKNQRKKSFISVVATPHTLQGHEGLMLKMRIGEWTTQGKGEKEKVLWGPEIFTLDGQSTEFLMDQDQGKKQAYTIQVTPTLL